MARPFDPEIFDSEIFDTGQIKPPGRTKDYQKPDYALPRKAKP